MIDLEKDTPIEYSKQSRDYQVFDYLYNAVFNQSKMYVDQIPNIWSDYIDDKLLLLRAYTLNFIPYYQWSDTDLRGATNNFRYLVRGKGTKDAIKACLEILARVRGLELRGIDVKITKKGLIKLIISEEISDTGNIEDLLRYILPAGSYYEIIKYSKQEGAAETNIVVGDELEPYNYKKAGIVDAIYESDSLMIPNSEGYILPTTTMSYSTSMLVTSGNESNSININISGTTIEKIYNGNQQTITLTTNGTGDGPIFSVKNMPLGVKKIKLFDKAGNEIQSINLSATDTGRTVYKLDSKSLEFRAYSDEECTKQIFGVKFNVINNPELVIKNLDIIVKILLKNKTSIYDGTLHKLDLELDSYTVTPTSYADKITVNQIDSSQLEEQFTGVYDFKEFINLIDYFNIYCTDEGVVPNIEFIGGTLTINPLTINSNIFAVGPETDKIYNGVNQEINSATIRSRFPSTYDIRMVPDISNPATKALVVDNLATIITYGPHGKDVGLYNNSDEQLVFRDNTNIKLASGFNLNLDKYKLHIERKDITVKANDIIYLKGGVKEKLPTYDTTITGMISGEPTSLIEYNIDCPYRADDPVGTYPITVTGDSEQGNYFVSYINGTLTVLEKTKSIPGVIGG